MARFEAVQCDRARLAVMLQCFAKECFRGRYIAPPAQMRFHGAPALVDCSVEVHPLAAYLYICLVATPRSAGSVAVMDRLKLTRRVQFAKSNANWSRSEQVSGTVLSGSSVAVQSQSARVGRCRRF